MKTIPLADGVHVVMVDDADHARLLEHGWCLNRGGGNRQRLYAQANIKVGGQWKRVVMHRFLLGLTDPSVRCDHRDNNGLNNQRSNLRTATANQNQHNRRSCGGTSRFKGVSWYKRSKKWLAQICCDRTWKYLGTFVSEEDAARAYDAKARELHGEFAFTNFPAAPLPASA